MNEPQQEKILIIDDDEVFSQVLERSFKRRGFTTQVALTEADALHLATKFKPHLISLDLKLDQASGLKILPKLVNLLPEAKIVVLTGYSSIATAVEAIKLGATDYLCKPADADELLAAFNKSQGDPDADLASLPPSVNRLTWEHIQKVLQENDGNISATARALGMHRRTLQRKLQKRPVKR